MLKRDLGSDRDHLKYLRREALDWLAVSLMGWRTPRLEMPVITRSLKDGAFRLENPEAALEGIRADFDG
jgi:hypothetical protein